MSTGKCVSTCADHGYLFAGLTGHKGGYYCYCSCSENKAAPAAPNASCAGGMGHNGLMSAYKVCVLHWVRVRVHVRFRFRLHVSIQSVRAFSFALHSYISLTLFSFARNVNFCFLVFSFFIYLFIFILCTNA